MSLDGEEIDIGALDTGEAVIPEEPEASVLGFSTVAATGGSAAGASAADDSLEDPEVLERKLRAAKAKAETEWLELEAAQIADQRMDIEISRLKKAQAKRELELQEAKMRSAELELARADKEEAGASPRTKGEAMPSDDKRRRELYLAPPEPAAGDTPKPGVSSYAGAASGRLSMEWRITAFEGDSKGDFEARFESARLVVSSGDDRRQSHMSVAAQYISRREDASGVLMSEELIRSDALAEIEIPKEVRKVPPYQAL